MNYNPYVDLATIDAMLYMLAGMHVVHTSHACMHACMLESTM